jgi:hypothetical protein
VSLDRFAEASSSTGGVWLANHVPLDCVEVETRNSRYRLQVLDPAEGRVLIQGGAVFAIAAEVVVAGASIGGSMLKTGWILPGFCLEVLRGGERIITTAIRRVALNPPDAVMGPF